MNKKIFSPFTFHKIPGSFNELTDFLNENSASQQIRIWPSLLARFMNEKEYFYPLPSCRSTPEMRLNKTTYSILVFVGSLLCVVVGILLSMRAPGNGKTEFRKTHDLMPFFGTGVFLILSTLAFLLLPLKKRRGVLLICLLDVVGAATLLVGSIVVAVHPGAFPLLLFSGFLLSVAGFILTGVSVLRHRLLSPAQGYGIVLAGIALLFFNDQYIPWMSAVLGLVACWLAHLLFKTRQPAVWRSEKMKA